jgi:hypothetical protein
MDAFDLCIPFVLKEEGGYCCLPGDNGGATCRGVTMATLAAWRGCAVTVQDVEHLSEQEARNIYRAMYWDKVRGDELPPAVALVMLDSGLAFCVLCILGRSSGAVGHRASHAYGRRWTSSGKRERPVSRYSYCSSARAGSRR